MSKSLVGRIDGAHANAALSDWLTGFRVDWFSDGVVFGTLLCQLNEIMTEQG